ncbi:hypothetical protein [Kribbella sp. DT2]|uniref:hypothetical protein n=1 Tax=Kribbella sp. DT2 TaxID=3393427 RepID=UPI003CF95AD1
MSFHALRHVIDGSLAFAFSDHTCHLNVRLFFFRDAHHDSLQLTQLTVVWNPRLHNDSEGPTFISSTAFQSSNSGFYIRTPQSNSGHTVNCAQQDEVFERSSLAIGHRFDESGGSWKRPVDVRYLYRDDRLVIHELEDRVRTIREVAGSARQPVQRFLHPGSV